MKIQFCVKGKERKALAAAISEIIGQPLYYEGTPSFAYKVGCYGIDRDGSLTYDETTGQATADALLESLGDRGFIRITEGSVTGYYSDAPESTPQEAETEQITEAPPIVWFGERPSPYRDGFYSDGPHEDDIKNYAFEDAPVYVEPFPDAFSIDTPQGQNYISTEPVGGLTIEMPLDSFTDASFENLKKMVASKEALIMKSIGVFELPIEKTEATIRFPWFPADPEPDETDAYTRLVSALCAAAKEQKRVTAKEKPVENEKFAFRVFLIRLGFVGGEFKTARKILLRNLTGNSAFKDGTPPKGDAAPGE